MKVLVACEESQAVCKAFRKRGHEAYSCDIVECSGGHPEWHIQGDVLEILNPEIKTVGFGEDVPEWYGIDFITMDRQHHFIDGNWDLIIAHPPCTYLTNAGARWLYKGGKLNQERFEKGLAAKEFFMALLNADCEKIAVENPVPSRCFELPEYTQTIQPYEHGHPHTKKTCLWLKNLPELVPSNPCQPTKGKRFKQKNGNYRFSCWEMEQKGGKDRAKERSKTFPGIAEAMAEQWGRENE